MSLLNMQEVTVNLGGQALLERASLAVEPGERLCITGRNGAGKSTLLAVLGGQLDPDSGLVIRDTEKIGQMPQDVPRDWQGSVFNLVAGVLGEEGAALNAAHLVSGSGEAGGGFAGGSNSENSGGTKHLSENEAREAEKLLSSGAGWERYGEILGIIKHLDLDPDADFAALSGGTKRRVALARALVCSEDLILDEPTNHLDLATITWLEDFLLRKARTLIFVSHDRAFSQRLATRIVEVDRGRLHNYECNYAQYASRREERLEIEERHFDLFDKKLAQEESWIRQGIKARRTRNMGRVRALYEMRRERAARRERQGNVSMQAQEAEKSGKLVIEAVNLSFAYPDSAPLFSGFSAIIQRGDKIGIIGGNGTGKSTLIKLLLGELEPTSGSVRHGTNLQISYFDQLRESLDPEELVMRSVAEGNDVVTINGNTRHVAGYLQDFLFTPDRLRLPVKALSGGERNRLLLARLFTRPSNVLVLDEPTNDLDVETLELLEELLSEYSGTVLLVSHDRTFLDNLVTSTLALEGDGQVHEYVGAYTDWLRQRVNQDEAAKGHQNTKGTTKGSGAAGEPGRGGKPGGAGLGGSNGGSGAAPGSPGPIGSNASTGTSQSKRKLTFNEQRELTQLEKTLAGLPDKLAALEAEQAQLEQALQDPDFYGRDPEGFTRATERLSALEEEQLELLQNWEEAETRLQKLKEI